MLTLRTVRIQRQSVPELETKLQPYDLGSSELLAKYPNIWRDLTSSLKGAFLTNITGHKWNHWQVSSADEYKSSETGKPGEETGFLKNESLTFVFPKSQYTFSTTSVGRERTEQAMDTSGHIMAIISNCSYEDHDEIIGELQFCYVTGMILGNVACKNPAPNTVDYVFF
jgi:A1 cistron-splicing factor AAR2